MQIIPGTHFPIATEKFEGYVPNDKTISSVLAELLPVLWDGRYHKWSDWDTIKHCCYLGSGDYYHFTREFFRFHLDEVPIIDMYEKNISINSKDIQAIRKAWVEHLIAFYEDKGL